MDWIHKHRHPHPDPDPGTASGPGQQLSANASGAQEGDRQGSDGSGRDKGRAALAALCAMLQGLPHALMLCNRELAAALYGDGTADGSDVSYAHELWMPELAVPESLMLAVYPGLNCLECGHTFPMLSCPSDVRHLCSLS